jgi:hypothetical protein
MPLARRPLIILSTCAASCSGRFQHGQRNAAQRRLHHAFARPPDAVFLQQRAQRAPLRHAGLELEQRADFLGDGPQHQRQRLALAFQAFEHAHQAAGSPASIASDSLNTS